MSVFIGYPSFMAYQMMKGKKGNNDGFPSIPGMIARYSALGLTNEQMAANPVWVDKTGNGHDIQLKNFSWKGMSGVGGYVQDFNYFRNNATVDKVRIDEQSSNSIKVTLLTSGRGNVIYIPKGIYQFNKSYFIKISSEGYNEGDLFLSFYAPSTSTATTVKVPLNPNGITEIPAIKEDDYLAVYLFNAAGKGGSLTIEQLPLYPGFILGDGVDDFAVTEKELNSEDTYTVYTAFIPFQNNPTKNMMMAGKDIKDFYMNYSSLNALSYYSGKKSVVINLSNGFNLLCCKRDADNMTIKNLITGDSVTATANEFINNPGLYYLWRVANGYSYARLAIAGQTICNGYFSTDEDDEKVLDWYKKQYPWLFPEQAWTVTGKTNEDEDRATIANIMGNGNDLVLSNFGFAGNSGYGLYSTNAAKYQITSDMYTKVFIPLSNIKSIRVKFVLSGLIEENGEIFILRIRNNVTTLYQENYSKNGTYIFTYEYTGEELIQLIGYNNIGPGEEYPKGNFTIDIIPDYEGYLVTDGVDDKAVSKQFKFGENFTVILDFKFPVKKISYCGFDLSSKVRILNLQGSGVYVVLKGNKTLIPSNVVRAVTSEGKVYDENWNEYNIVPGNISSNYTMVNLGFDGSNQFAESATKLAGIYSSTLSKDECIKAYNYLQTLKAK